MNANNNKTCKRKSGAAYRAERQKKLRLASASSASSSDVLKNFLVCKEKPADQAP